MGWIIIIVIVVIVIASVAISSAEEQNKRTLREGIKGEELNIVIGSIPISTEDDEVKNAVSNDKLDDLVKSLNGSHNIKENNKPDMHSMFDGCSDKFKAKMKSEIQNLKEEAFEEFEY